MNIQEELEVFFNEQVFIETNVRKVSMDIETGTASELLVGSFKPPVKVSKVLKDPEKIRVATEEAEQKFFEDAALSPLTGQILMHGFMDNKETIIVHEGDEKTRLQLFWATYDRIRAESGVIVGWNIKVFDFPFIIRRSWKHNIKPSWNPYIDPYNDLVIDLMEVFKAAKYSRDMYSLKDVAEFLGIGTKSNEDSKNFQKLYNEDINLAINHLTKDLELTKQIQERIF